MSCVHASLIETEVTNELISGSCSKRFSINSIMEVYLSYFQFSSVDGTGIVLIYASSDKYRVSHTI